MELVNFQKQTNKQQRENHPPTSPLKNYYERLNFLHIEKTLMRKFSKYLCENPSAFFYIFFVVFALLKNMRKLICCFEAYYIVTIHHHHHINRNCVRKTFIYICLALLAFPHKFRLSYFFFLCFSLDFDK